MRLSVVRSAALGRWDAKFLLHDEWSWSDDRALPFGEVAVRRIDPVDKAAFGHGELRIGSIHFNGSITVRSERGRELVGRLYFAHPDDLVFSKIDARNGAMGVVPAEIGTLAFTSEYPIYDFASRGKLRAGFVKLLCRTAAFRARVNALAVGHSGRKRVSPQAMEALLIPVPDLDCQDSILAELDQQLQEARELQQQATSLRQTVAGLVLERLGIEHQPFHRIAQPFVVQFKDLDRWSLLRAMMAVEGISEEPVSRYSVRRLGDPDIGTISYGVTKSPANRPGLHARPYLRVANVQAGRLDLNEIKLIDVPDREMAKYRLHEGDLLLCEGNSVDLVGRPALWRGEIVDCVHQNHIIKVRLSQDVVDPEFSEIYMNTPPARRYMLARAKRTTNLASINSTDVAEFPIPVPPLHVQRTIVNEVAEIRKTAEQLGAQADQARLTAQACAEQSIFDSASRINPDSVRQATTR